MIDISREELDNVKQQLNEAQKRSHFVIFATFDPQSKEHLHMITDYKSYLSIKKERNANTPMHIVRDIVPVTDNLAMWAIAENQASQIADDPDAIKKMINVINTYINKVLVDNKLPQNE